MIYYFITGTSKGIGKAIAEAALKEDNIYVFGISRNVSINHTRYHHQHLDLSDITALRNNLHKVFISLDKPEKIVLINNAGIVGEVGYIGSLPTDNFEFVFDVNVIAPAILMNAFLSAFQDVPCPKIILNISSGAAKRPVDGWSAYCASKAALDMISLTCQREQELLNSNVKVYSLSPGVVDTAMQQHIREADASMFSTLERFQNYKQNNELQDPGEVAEKILKFLNTDPRTEQVVVRITEI